MNIKGLILNEYLASKANTIYLTYVWNLKKLIKADKQKPHRYREQIAGCQRQGVGRGGQDERKVVQRHRLSVVR